ncbi:twin-arginine translocase TatA/TatE family subunit [Caminibacter sp.]
MGVSTWQIVVILLVVLLLFGGKKIPELASGLGKGIKNFKDAVKEGEETDIKTTEKTDKIENQTTTANSTTKEQEKNA